MSVPAAVRDEISDPAKNFGDFNEVPVQRHITINLVGLYFQSENEFHIVNLNTSASKRLKIFLSTDFASFT